MTAPALKVQIQGQGVVSADNLNTYEQTCNTFADLRSFIGTDGIQVVTRGGGAINDGLGGFFYWDASSPGPDNNTTIIVPVGVTVGAWVRTNFPQSINVITPIESLADLRTISPIADVIYYVDGHTTAGDGGGGFFLSTTTNPGAENDGTIIWSDTPGFYFVRQATEAEGINVKWFGATGAGTVDDADAFTAALAAGDEVFVPDGIYRLDSAIEVTDGKALRLTQGTLLLRTTASAATTPVVYVLGIQAELTGGTVQSQNASPNGVVCLGNKDNADDRNAWWWRFLNCTVKGLNTANNIGVNVPSGQVTNALKANYFGCIQNINVFGADVGVLFAEYANAHNASNIQYWDCRTACLELRGAYGNNIVGQFMHAGAASGVVGVKISNKTVGSQESTQNNVLGFTVETGGGADQGVTIASNATKNTVIGNDNVAGGNTVSNADNLVSLRGVVRYCSQANIDTVQLNTKLLIKNTSSGTRDSFDESNNTISAVAADATLVLKTKIVSGLLVIRNASDGLSALALVDEVAGIVLIEDGGFVVTSDPGSGTSKFWLQASGTETKITNRYAASKQMDLRTMAAT